LNIEVKYKTFISSCTFGAFFSLRKGNSKYRSLLSGFPFKKAQSATRWQKVRASIEIRHWNAAYADRIEPSICIWFAPRSCIRFFASRNLTCFFFAFHCRLYLRIFSVRDCYINNARIMSVPLTYTSKPTIQHMH